MLTLIDFLLTIKYISMKFIQILQLSLWFKQDNVQYAVCNWNTLNLPNLYFYLKLICNLTALQELMLSFL